MDNIVKQKVIIVGGFHEIIELCETCQFDIVGIIDNMAAEDYWGYPILGNDEEASNIYKSYSECKIIISPDSPQVREKLYAHYDSIGFDFATVISPQASISRSATIGKGSIVQSGVNISSATKIGRFCKLNTNANVMHDNIVSDFVTIAPNAVSLGRIKIGEGAYIGANSTILPEIEIGRSAIIGAGAVVTKDVPDYIIVKGVPAR